MVAGDEQPALSLVLGEAVDDGLTVEELSTEGAGSAIDEISDLFSFDDDPAYQEACAQGRAILSKRLIENFHELGLNNFEAGPCHRLIVIDRIEDIQDSGPLLPVFEEARSAVIARRPHLQPHISSKNPTDDLALQLSPRSLAAAAGSAAAVILIAGGIFVAILQDGSESITHSNEIEYHQSALNPGFFIPDLRPTSPEFTETSESTLMSQASEIFLTPED